MAKAELGTKRICPNCGTKYYDLNRDPILCPKCGTPFTVMASISRAKAAPVVDDEDEVEENKEVDFVSLEDADAEQGAEADVADLGEDDVDVGTDEDDTFLEEEEDDDDIGGLEIDVEADEEER